MTNEEKEIIVGTVLGDSSIRKGKTDKYNFLTCQHGPKQKEYAEWKAHMLGQNSLKTTCKSYTRLTPNKKTGKIYDVVAMRICNNIELDYFREIFYDNNIKRITNGVLDYYTPLAMAVHFMDDGHRVKERGTMSIATNNFDLKSLKKFRLYLFDKYDIETNLTHDKRITIRKKTQDLFTELIRPYIIKSLHYKVS